MKKRIIHLLIFIYCIAAFPNVFSQSQGSGFYLGTFHFPNMATYHSQAFMERYSQLSYNSMIGYIAHVDTDKTCIPFVWGGFYDAITPDYYGRLNNMITNGFEKYFGANNFMLLLEREKILRPAYGQSSKYQAEYKPSELKNYRPAYGYTYVYGDVVTDGNAEVRKCKTGVNTAGYMLSGLYENLEQVNFYTQQERRNDYDLLYNMNDRKSHTNRWYINPRIKIDPVFAAANPDAAVVSVITKNYAGRTIDSTVLTCRNFGKLSNGRLNYNGEYVEHFYKGGNENSIFFINVLADDLTSGIIPYQGPHYLDHSKVDYQVYWHGKADVYLDYVKVEDEWAHDLLTDSDLLPPEKDFKAKVNAELDMFVKNGYTNTAQYFYLDEFNYNNLPCIAYVNELIRNKISNSGLVVLTNDYLTRSRIGSGLKNGPVYSDKYNYMFSSGAVKDFFLTEIYPFDDSIPLPATIPMLPNKGTYRGTVGYITAPNNNYNDRLHYNLERGFNYSEVNANNGQVPSYMDRFRKCAYTLKNNDIKILGIALPFHTEEIEFGVRMREPTVEEMNMMSYLAIAYGANAIYEFSFGSRKRQSNPDYYSWGIDSINKYVHPCDETSAPKYYNYYGQAQYAGILKLNASLRKLGDFMYDKSKGPLVYDDTRTINAKFGTPNDADSYGLPFKYVQDIQSVFYSGGYNDNNTDPSEKRYWEIGFFNPRQSEAGSNVKYFIAVNKRCAPGDKSTGDYRQLRIKFDASQLTGANSWVVKDVLLNAVVASFDKNPGEYVTIGEFQPGEGRLFVLMPGN